MARMVPIPSRSRQRVRMTYHVATYTWLGCEADNDGGVLKSGHQAILLPYFLRPMRVIHWRYVRYNSHLAPPPA